VLLFHSAGNADREPEKYLIVIFQVSAKRSLQLEVRTRNMNCSKGKCSARAIKLWQVIAHWAVTAFFSEIIFSTASFTFVIL
jgi:hypothetical protein